MNLIINNMMRPLTTADMDAICDAVAKRSGNGNVQLSILSRAMVALCKTLGIPRHVLVREINAVWEQTPALVNHEVAGRGVN